MLNQSDEELIARYNMQTPTTKAANLSGNLSFGRASAGLSHDFHDKVMKETEAKCSKLLADAESRVLDERNKYNKMEMSMKEDLMKERAKGGEVTQQKVNTLLEAYRQEAERTTAFTTQHHSTVLDNVQTENRGRVDDLEEKVRRMETQLAERERELAAAERRHQEEKKELLALRTNQLRLESSKKGQEGDMVNRAMATIAEYEDAVRKSEAENAQRLSEYMEGFTNDWLNRAKDFEAHKSVFEAEVMDKAFRVLQEQEGDLAKKEEAMRLRMVEILSQQGGARAEQEQLLLEQFEKFKFEYKTLQDRDFQTRCELFDQALEKRERLLFERISAEREKLLATEASYADAAEMQRVQSLNEAMTQIASMREQVLADNQKKQEEVHKQLLSQRDQMHNEMVELEKQKSEQVATMQQKIVESMNEAHRIVASVKQQMAQTEQDIHDKYLKEMQTRNVEIDAEKAKFKDELERQYFEKLNKLNDEHSAEMTRLSEKYLGKQHQESSDGFKREQEIRMCFEAKLANFEEAVQQKYKKQLNDASDAESSLKETIAMLRREVSEITQQLQQQQMSAKTRELTLEGKLAKAQRDVDQAKAAAEEELRERYEKWLEDAMQGAHKAAIDKLEYERMQREVEAADQRCLDLIRRERETMTAEKDHMKEACERRIAEERRRLEQLEVDLLEKVADMRVELEAEMKRKEASNQRLFEAERKSLYDEATERAIEERRERQAFEERVKEMDEARWRAVNKDMQTSCEDRIRANEQKISGREAELDTREAALRQEKLAHHQKVIEDRQKLDSDEWDMKVKLEHEVRREAEQRLAAERERLQAELDTIRQHAVEQQKTMEETRAQLQRAMQEEKTKSEQEVQQRYEALLEQAIKDNRDALAQREATMNDKEAAIREKHQTAIKDIRELHRKELDSMEQKLDSLRGEVELEKAKHEKEANEIFRQREEAIRMEAQARIKAEQEALRQKELQMQFENDRARLEMEAAARETMQQLFDGRTKNWEDADDERKKSEAEFFAKMQAQMVEKDAELLAKQKKFEEVMKDYTERALQEQKKAIEAAQGQELLSLREECNQLRMKLQKQAQINSIDDSAKFEARLAEMRKALEASREDERRLTIESADRQVAEAQKRCDNRISDITRDLEAQMATLREKLSTEKEQQQLALLKKDEEANRKLDELRDQLQAKTSRQCTRTNGASSKNKNSRGMITGIFTEHIVRAAGFDKQKLEYDSKVKANYEKLLKEAERAQREALEERERQRSVMDREKDRTIQQLRQDIDMMKLNETDLVENKVRDKANELTRQLQNDKQEYIRIVDAEREKREIAEQQMARLQQELDKVSASMNQWKLELHKSLVSKYEHLFNEVQSRARKDREAFARRLLEEEERRLARELVRKDNELARARSESDRSATKDSAERERTAQVLELQQKMKRLFEAFGNKKEKLMKMWEVIDTDPAERMQLLAGVFGQLGKLGASGDLLHDMSPRRSMGVDVNTHMLDVVTGVYEEVCNEVARLEAQLPLMDIITRREFVKHRLSEVLHADPGAREQALELRRELQKLNEQLLHDLPRYEQAHNAKLFYKNQRYLLVMEKDMQHEAVTPAPVYTHAH